MNKEDFESVEGYFNDWVDLPYREQNSKLNQLRESGELTTEHINLLVDLLASDSQDDMPEDVYELAFDLNADFAQETLNENSQLGNYRLLKLLGLGGMGFVYLAERNDGTFDKQVAIKFSKVHFKKSLIKRFENERQILAKLTHPNIAQLLDGGTDEQERPYIVMEYVSGQPINQFCAQKKLNIKGRLDLILQVCSAVAFAHQNLVLHRDLK
ncbi:MAG: protein kinase, partial [Xanthomonadales bacterium]|nr:protein kinase [Xanthomonadales bacterium]